MNISDGHVDADVQGVDIRRQNLEVSPQCKRVSTDNIMQQQHLPENNTDTGWLLSAGSSASIADDDDLDGMNNLSSTSFLRRAQPMSIVISLILSPVAIVVVSIWASVLGGVSWSEGDAKHNMFNWHCHDGNSLCNYECGNTLFELRVHLHIKQPCSSSSSSLRNVSSSSLPSAISPDPKNRRVAKFSHASMWTLNVVFGTVGVLAVFKSHNDPISGYIANMYSLHSWAGMTVLSLYAIQYLVGMLAFSGLSGRRRISNPILMEIHKFAGSYIHILATTTILLGIQEKEGFVSCAYTVESPDVPPEFNVGKIPYPCKISHGLGVVILLMGLCTNFGLAKL